MKTLDITMTAVIRPDILNSTLKSFCDNVFTERDKYRLIINIDPIGDDNKTPEDMLNVCRGYFKNIIYNIPIEPSFPKAVIWTWNQISSNYVFHLEDDWHINRPIDIKNMLKILDKNSHLACLRLYKHDIPNKKNPKLFNSPYTYRDANFFEANDRKKQFGLNPVLIRSSFIKEALPLMVTDKNPEKQFRFGNEKMRDLVMRWSYAIYGNPGDRVLVEDGGLQWRKNSKFDKPNDGSQFVTWRTKNE